VYDAGDPPPPPAASCDLSIDPNAGIALTTTKTKTGGWRVNEFFQGSSDRISIKAPSSFAAPPGAEFRCTLRDDRTGETVATFSVPAPVFQSSERAYVFTGSALRNFIGDTSRPATDKTLRGAVKPYIDALLARGRLADDGDAVSLRLTASLVAEQQEVPIDGGITIDITRRGRTATVEPAPEPRDATAP